MRTYSPPSANAPEDEPPPAPRARGSWLKRVFVYSGGAVLAPVAAVVIALIVFLFFPGAFDRFLSSSSLGDPSSANVIDSDLAWSPDSRWIAFDRSDYGGSGENDPVGQSEVFVARADGRGLRQLTRTPGYEAVLGWLPNPLRVVYTSPTKDPIMVYAMTLKGKRTALGEVRATDQVVALSPDGKRLLVGAPLNADHYVLIDLSSGTRRTLPGVILDPDMNWPIGAWSPDGRQLAYAADDDILILREDRVVRRIDGYGHGGLAWSPDGRRFAWSNGWKSDTIWIARFDGGSPSPLVRGEDDNNYDPVWSPGGRAIYYSHDSWGDHDGLRAISPSGVGDRKISGNDWGNRWLDNVTFSPDGTKIAYLLGELGAWKNWSLAGVMNADGSGKTPFPGSV